MKSIFGFLITSVLLQSHSFARIEGDGSMTLICQNGNVINFVASVELDQNFLGMGIVEIIKNFQTTTMNLNLAGCTIR